MIKDTPHLVIRRSPQNPNHHLWLNNGTWWLYFTLKATGSGSVRKRVSLKTHDIEAARRQRDRILNAIKTTPFAI